MLWSTNLPSKDDSLLEYFYYLTLKVIREDVLGSGAGLALLTWLGQAQGSLSTPQEAWPWDGLKGIKDQKRLSSPQDGCESQLQVYWNNPCIVLRACLIAVRNEESTLTRLLVISHPEQINPILINHFLITMELSYWEFAKLIRKAHRIIKEAVQNLKPT